MASGAPTDDDDGELELEPVDPEVLAHERARAQAHTERVLKKVDVDEFFDDHPGAFSDLEVGWSHWRQFRFSTRHLLIATALLAIGLTMLQFINKGLALFLIVVGLIAAAWRWVVREEERLARERRRRRAEFEAELARARGDVTFVGDEDEDEPPPLFRRSAFDVKFSFSLRQLFLTMTIATVAVALLQMLGGPEVLAMVLGLVAMAGLIAYWAGLDPPPFLVHAWWWLLVAYLIIGVMAALTAQASAAGVAALPPCAGLLALAPEGLR